MCPLMRSAGCELNAASGVVAPIVAGSMPIALDLRRPSRGSAEYLTARIVRFHSRLFFGCQSRSASTGNRLMDLLLLY